MIDMSALRSLSAFGPMTVIEIMSSLIVLIVSIVVAGKKGYAALQNWRTGQNAKDDEKKTVKERLSALEKEDDKQDARLEKLEAGQAELKDLLLEIKEQNRTQTVAMMRSTLMRLAAEGRKQTYFTEAQYETFRALADQYLALNGNGLYKNKIIPEMEKLPIKED